MTPRSRTMGLLVLALALVAPVAGCASVSGGSGSEGTGALGEAPAGGQDAAGADDGSGDGSGASDPTSAPEPSAAPPEETTPDDPPPGGVLTFGPIFTIGPGVLLLPWPSPADCVSHNPDNVTINNSGTLWQVLDGSHALMAFRREADAQAGLRLAKSFKKHCFVGRDNTRPDSERYIMDYWLEPVRGAAAIADPDCLTHDPANLTVHDLGATGWLVQDGSESIALLDNQVDAQDAVKVMKHYNRHCYIGRGYSGSDRLKYIVNWFVTV